MLPECISSSYLYCYLHSHVELPSLKYPGFWSRSPSLKGILYVQRVTLALGDVTLTVILDALIATCRLE